MREILFRGKRTDGREWVEGCLINIENYCCILELDCRDYGNTYLDPEIGWVDGQAVPVIPETVGQYTGLNDKNGKKIFEGDVVDISACEGWGMCGPATYDNPNVVVTYNSGYAGFDPFSNYDCDCGVSYNNKDVTVLGNIHDNPELLEVK
jgi:uncharacterized phage protein (TIGR01671 family)